MDENKKKWLIGGGILIGAYMLYRYRKRKNAASQSAPVDNSGGGVSTMFMPSGGSFGGSSLDTGVAADTGSTSTPTSSSADSGLLAALLASLGGYTTQPTAPTTPTPSTPTPTTPKKPTTSWIDTIVQTVFPTPVYTAPVEYVAQTTKDATAIDQIYRDVLGRSADSSGLGYWNSQVQDGTMTIAEVTKAITQSPENVIQDLYTSTLGRAADASGLAYWTAQVNTGRTDIAGVTAAFQQSAEYTSTHATAPIVNAATMGIAPQPPNSPAPAATPAPIQSTPVFTQPTMPAGNSAIMDAYVQILGRSADDGGLSYWSGQVSSGAMTVDDVRNALSASDEARDKWAA